MTARLMSALDTMKAVRQETRLWVHHLTGEGPATVRRQREAAQAAVIADRPGWPEPRPRPGGSGQPGHALAPGMARGTGRGPLVPRGPRAVPALER